MGVVTLRETNIGETDDISKPSDKGASRRKPGEAGGVGGVGGRSVTQKVGEIRRRNKAKGSPSASAGQLALPIVICHETWEWLIVPVVDAEVRARNRQKRAWGGDIRGGRPKQIGRAHV